MKFRIFLLTLANIIAILILLYILEFAGVINYYSRIKKTVNSVVLGKKIMRSEDMNLVEKMEINKAVESLYMKQSDLSKKEKDLDEREKKIVTGEEEVNNEKKMIEKKKQKMKEDEQLKTEYKVKVQDLANKYYNMPPDKSVERIVELKDDILILDIFKEMDAIAAGKGQNSIVPYLYSLMDKETAARLLRKSTVSE